MRKVTYLLGILVLVLTARQSFGDAEEITLKLTSLHNVTGNGAMEACGSASHKNGTKPLLVTIKHDESYYTTLTAPNDQWCVVLKRWTYSGKVEASATTLGNPGYFSLTPLTLNK